MPETNIKSKKLYFKIKNKFQQENYSEVILKVEEYLSYEGIEVPPTLAYYYGYALQKMGRLEEAYSAYKKAIFLGGDDLLKTKVAYQLHDTPYINAAIALLEELVNKPGYDNFQGYYLLGKIKLNLGMNNIALNLFEKALSFATTPEDLKRVKLNLKKTLNRLKNKTAPINFATYKNMGNTIRPGQVVFLKKHHDIPISDFGDTKKKLRPYLVFDVTDEQVYAFPLTNIKPNTYYVNKIYGQYINSDTDSYVIPEVATFTEHDIDNISGLVEPKFFNELLSRLYKSFLHLNPDTLNSNKIYFIKMFNSKLQPEANDIIVLFNFALKQEYHYFVLEELENGYKCIPLKVNNGFYEPLPYELTISHDTILLKIFKTPEIMCNRILNQLKKFR